jgi:O-antigen biosynthesis protein
MRGPIPVDQDGLPYGAAVIRAATRDPSGWLILGLPGDIDHPDERLGRLLLGDFSIEGVVPGGSQTGPPARQPVARDVEPRSTEFLAVRASAVVCSPIDPYCEDPSAVIAVVLRRLHALRKRVVCDPDWAAGTGTAETEDPLSADHILVVTGSLESRSLNEVRRAAWDLIELISASARAAELTVVAAERSDNPADVAYLRARGIDAHEGPIDWGDWFTARRDAFSYVVLTSTGLHSSVREWIGATQPRAAKVMFWPRMPFREVTALRSITPAVEQSGLELVRLRAEETVLGLSRWADAVWCESDADASYLASTVDKPLFRIPPAVVPTSDWTEPDRSGVAIAAVEGYDTASGSDEAAVRALETLLPQLRWRAPALECTVVSDRPTPLLESAALTAGARVVASAELEDVLASSRLLVCAHHYGTGQPSVIMKALAAGTPFVATPSAIGDLDLGDLRGRAVFASEADLVARSWQLISSATVRHGYAAASQRLLVEQYDPSRRAEALISALAHLGVDAGREPDRWPADKPPRSRRVLPSPTRVGLRPDETPEVPPWRGYQPDNERARYQLWAERFGPTPPNLRSIREALDHLQYRPRISILMPVYNTDPGVLLDALDSVRAQIYGNWQLCIADDGSDRAETRQVLASLDGEAAVEVVRLPGSTGISGATNAALAVADGDFVTFLDHDDILKPHALAQVARWLDADPTLDLVYSDEDKLDELGRLYDPHLKPDWSPDLLTTQNYLCHLTVARRSLVEDVGGFRSEYDGSQDYDLFLRLTERTDRIAHIPEPLYSWRAVPGSAAAVVDAKPYAIAAARRAVADALERRGYDGRVDETSRVGCFRARYPFRGQPKVSIIIPTKNRGHLLHQCISSITQRSTYSNFEIVVIDNQSTESEALGYLATGPARVIRYSEPFNYARMMNFGARSVECDALLFLNNDTEVMNPDWIEGLLEHAMRPEVGAVGGRLFFGNGEPQHEGIMLAVGGGWAYNVNHDGYWFRGDLTRNTTAVTGACTMIRPSVYWRVGGNDERLRVAYNDVDLCLRIRQAGYEIVYTPFVELHHYESASRSGYEHPLDGPLFGARWRPRDFVDPYYSPVLSERQPFKIRI